MRTQSLKLSREQFDGLAGKLKLAPRTIDTIRPMVVKGFMYKDAILGRKKVVSESSASRAIRKLRELKDKPTCPCCGHVLAAGAQLNPAAIAPQSKPEVDETTTLRWTYIE